MINTYLKILKCTSFEYNRLASKEENTLYLLTDSKEIYVGEELYISPSNFHKLTLLNATDLDRETSVNESITENYTSENCIVNGYYNNNHNYLLININRPDLEKIIQWKIGRSKTKDDDEVTSTFEYRTINKNNNFTTSWTPIADDSLNTSSTNPIQNKVVTNKINNLESKITEIGQETGEIATDGYYAWDTKTGKKWSHVDDNNPQKPGYQMRGTYSLIGDYCFLSACADKVENAIEMLYSLPTPAVLNTGGGTTSTSFNYNDGKQIPDPYLISIGTQTGANTYSVVRIRKRDDGTMTRSDLSSSTMNRTAPENLVYFTLIYKYK